MFQNMFSEFKQFKKEKESIIKQISKVSKTKKETEKELSLSYDSKPFIRRFFDFNTREKIELIRKEIYKLDHEISDNKNEVSDRFVTLKNNMIAILISQKDEDKNTLFSLEKSYSDIHPIINIIADAHSYGVNAINTIDFAIQNIKSAQMIETVDIASNNKAISLMSSTYNTSAAQHISNANIAINAFKSKIYAVETHVKNFKKNPVSGCSDISFQMFMDSHYSSIVSSFMSLNTLNVAESQLIESKKQIEGMANQIYIEHEILTKSSADYQISIKDFKAKFEKEADILLSIEGIKV